jgi:hypothetical protein
MEPIQKQPEQPSEPTPFEKFDALTKRVISVPRSEILKRDAEWKEQRKHDKPRPR